MENYGEHVGIVFSLLHHSGPAEVIEVEVRAAFC